MSGALQRRIGAFGRAIPLRRDYDLANGQRPAQTTVVTIDPEPFDLARALSVQEAADRLGVDRNTIDRWRLMGKLEGRQVRSRWFFMPSQVDVMSDPGRRPPTDRGGWRHRGGPR